MKKVMWTVGVILSAVLLFVFAAADYDFTTTGMIAGLVVGTVIKVGIIVGVVLFVIWLFMRKKKG